VGRFVLILCVTDVVQGGCVLVLVSVPEMYAYMAWTCVWCGVGVVSYYVT
jgi:hypothetical protein